MANHAVDFGIRQFLCGGVSLLRIGGIIFGHQHEAYFFACDGEIFSIQCINGHARAIFIILAEVSDLA